MEGRCGGPHVAGLDHAEGPAHSGRSQVGTVAVGGGEVGGATPATAMGTQRTPDRSIHLRVGWVAGDGHVADEEGRRPCCGESGCRALSSL
jgi:hypothetical protein